MDINPDEKYSIQVSDISVAELGKILGEDFAGSLQASPSPQDKKINFSISGVSKKEIFDHINKLI
ncbi:hypothetical protein MRBLMS1_002880 [Massilia sp. LMS1-1-1.1]